MNKIFSILFFWLLGVIAGVGSMYFAFGISVQSWGALAFFSVVQLVLMVCMSAVAND